MTNRVSLNPNAERKEDKIMEAKGAGFPFFFPFFFMLPFFLFLILILLIGGVDGVGGPFIP